MLAGARWLMLLYVVTLPIVWPLDTRILGIHVFATDLIFAAAFVFWRVSLSKGAIQFDRRYLLFVAAFFLAFLISAVFSTEPQRSLLKLVGVFYLIAVSLVIADLVRDLGFLKKLVYAWVVGSIITLLGTAIGLIGFYIGFDTMATNLFLFHSGSLPPGNYPRVRAFFENPNMTANYLNIAVMIVLGACLAKWISIRFAVSLAALLLGAAIVTISPGLGGIVISIGLWIAFGFGLSTRTRAVILTSVLSAALLVLLATVISPITREPENTVKIPFTEIRVEPSVRFLVWKNAIERGLEFPIIGRGAGTDAAHVRYQVLSGQKQLLRDAHQAWLNVFGQAGLVGLAAFVGLCGYLFSICRFRSTDGSERSTMLAACSCAFVGAFLFQNLFGSFEDARQLWVLIGMLVGLAAKNDVG